MSDGDWMGPLGLAAKHTSLISYYTKFLLHSTDIFLLGKYMYPVLTPSIIHTLIILFWTFFTHVSFDSH